MTSGLQSVCVCVCACAFVCAFERVCMCACASLTAESCAGAGCVRQAYARECKRRKAAHEKLIDLQVSWR